MGARLLVRVTTASRGVVRAEQLNWASVKSRVDGNVLLRINSLPRFESVLSPNSATPGTFFGVADARLPKIRGRTWFFSDLIWLRTKGTELVGP